MGDLRPLGVRISQLLKSRGVEVIFGIPGVHNIELYRGITQAGLTHILARHEQGAGFMADGYARASGRPGVAYVITGPGLCNILTALGQAYSDSVPVLVMSSCLDETAACRGQLHQMRDQAAAAATVCAWSLEARSASAAYGLVDRALAEFTATRARPRHIQVPVALLAAPAPPAPSAPPAARPSLRDAPPAAEPLAQAARMLAQAQHPLMIFGGGAVHAAPEARAVVAQCQAASFTTYAGRGIIAAGTPLHFGSWLARPESAAILGKADVVMVVGSELSEVDFWRADSGIRHRLIRVDLDAGVLGSLPADVAVLGDARAFLRALAHALPQRGRSAWQAAEVAAARARWYKESNSLRPHIAPICAALQAVLPETTMYFSDMTQFAYVAKEIWDMPAPGLWHHPYGFGTLGYALPAAIGGAVARLGARLGVRPQAPVVCIAGDYGFQYSLAELGTAVELGLSLPILLWDNGKLAEIEECMIANQIAPHGVVAYNPDFAQLAAAYGAGFAAPRSLAALQGAVAEALAAPRPTLIRLRPECAC
ncbi:MAG: 5-guanidino-2-oxopentanoate decarboxylase [Rhodobacteraceae bacterium]|nr:5-guanidino-2-oxopentanoate decarboxylase [Paracoccaceae bacterium]